MSRSRFMARGESPGYRGERISRFASVPSFGRSWGGRACDVPPETNIRTGYDALVAIRSFFVGRGAVHSGPGETGGHLPLEECFMRSIGLLP